MSRPIRPLSRCWAWSTEPSESSGNPGVGVHNSYFLLGAGVRGSVTPPTTTTTVCIRAGCQGQVSPAGEIQTSVGKGRQGRNEEVKLLRFPGSKVRGETWELLTLDKQSFLPVGKLRPVEGKWP